MFQLLKEPNFNFMSRGRLLLGLSAVVVVVAIIVLATQGLNLGIEFTGGTELQVKYATRPDVGAIRDALSQAGITSQTVTTIGDPEENEVRIRVGTAADPDSDQDLTGSVLAALRAGQSPGGRPDLNVAGASTLETLLGGVPGLASFEAKALAEAIAEHRKQEAIFASVDDLSAIDGMTAEILDYLREQAVVGPISMRSQSYIGPAVGRELLNKALLAIMLSLAGMLAYIWVRFQLKWGFAAVVALTHDTVVTLGLFSLFGKEMTLPVVAAFLTLVGYSVNDTVVVFDRIRENVNNRAAASLEKTVNLSINQTLSRTIITSGLTWVVVFGLYVFGGAALNPFAFVLTVGVLVGTYSSIYIASPLLVLWGKVLSGGQAGRAAAAADSAAPRAKKVRGQV